MRVFDVVTDSAHGVSAGLHVATLTFADDRDADEAIHRRNGYDFDGCRLRVEFSRGGRGRDGGRDGGRDAGRGPPKRSGTCRAYPWLVVCGLCSVLLGWLACESVAVLCWCHAPFLTGASACSSLQTSVSS